MIELDNITYVQYIEQEDKSLYDYAIKYAFSFNKAVDHLQIGDFMKQTFGFVKDLQFDMQQGLTWEQFHEYLLQITKKRQEKRNLLELCQIRSYFKAEIERITEIEIMTLSHDPTDEENKAGIESLIILGTYLQIRAIATTFHVSIREVRTWTYEECFTELVTQKRLYDYENSLNKILSKT